MAKRPRETVRVEGGSGVFDAFSSLTIVNDIEGPTEAIFEVGDDGAWEALEAVIAPGSEFAVFVNDRLRMTGRAEVNDVPGSVTEGFNLNLTCRTKLADARYASASQAVRVEKTTIKDFILALYAPHGFTEADFLFSEAAARELMTGKAAGGKDPVDLDAIQLEQAKVNPPETTYACAERHLRRHHLTHWDAPDGRILVGVPDDTQAPSYRALCRRRGPDTQHNNIVGCRKMRDWSEVPSDITVFGQTAGREVAKARNKGTAADLDLAQAFANAGHFFRPVVIPSEGAKTPEQAASQAKRELAVRSRRKDAWELTFDGWAYWDGGTLVPFAHNTTIDVDVEAIGGSAKGTYLVYRVEQRLSVNEAPTTKLSCVAQGIWAL